MANQSALPVKLTLTTTIKLALGATVQANEAAVLYHAIGK